MKKIKTTFAIIIVIALLLVTLSSCSEIDNDKTNSARENEVSIQSGDIMSQPNDIATQSEFQETRVEYGMVINPSVEYDIVTDEVMADNEELIRESAPLTVNINGNKNFKNEFFKHIKNSRILDIEDENYGQYSINKISDIKEFYNLDNSIIDGYKLLSINVYKGGFIYYYVPIEELDNELVLSLYIDVIAIVIARQENQYSSVSDKLKGFIEAGWFLTDDNFVYAKQHNHIVAQMGDTNFTIEVPDKLNDYEYLRDLCFKVIKTAELVVVEE